MSIPPACLPILPVLPILSILRLLGLICTLLASQSVNARTVYHCGSSFQDKPCGANDQTQKAQGTTKATGKESLDTPEIDAQCRQRGDDAKRIISMRGAGATQDRLLVDAEGDYRKQLIKDVYAQQGNASDIRAAIEKECMSAKEKDTGKTVTTPMQDAKAIGASNAEKSNSNNSSNDAVCKQLVEFVAGMNSVKLSDKTGTTAAILREQKQKLELQMKSLSCH